jgi:hypothetical protein
MPDTSVRIEELTIPKESVARNQISVSKAATGGVSASG